MDGIELVVNVDCDGLNDGKPYKSIVKVTDTNGNMVRGIQSLKYEADCSGGKLTLVILHPEIHIKNHPYVVEQFKETDV